MSELIIWCPWCRVKPKVKLGRLQHDQLHGDPYQGVVVYCDNPKCPVRPKLEAGNVYNGGLPKARSEAIAAWNTRPGEDALREALKGAREDMRDLNEYWNGGNGSAVDACQHTCEVSEKAIVAIEAALRGEGAQ